MNKEEKERIKHLIERCNECRLNACITCDICWSEVQAIEKQQAEIEKKDKIIDLMAKYIARIDIGEDICMNNLANTELCNEECSNCEECIKQYFERKIEQ